MGEREREALVIKEDWLLANVPFISFVCENDAAYSMRFMTAPEGKAFGYKVEDFVDNKQYYAASSLHPDDVDFVDKAAEQVAAGASPVAYRYRMVRADGSSALTLGVGKAVLDEAGKFQAMAGCAIEIDAVPALHGPPGVLSEPHKPARRRPPANRPKKIDAKWAAAQHPLLTFFTENDEAYTVRHISGSLEELMGYSAEEFVNARHYKPSSTVLPEDQDIADAYIEGAARGVGTQTVARLRLLDSEGNAFPVLIFARGAQPEGLDAVGVAGGVLDIRHIPAFQGKSGLLLK
ncbi:MAG: PAS domain-containing protein [Planctomycetes bacterium]|nr:PAS domain-containing protein [Planctomycetota bacterium]